MHQEEFSLMFSYLNDIQLMALKVIPFHPRLLSPNMVPYGKIAQRTLLLKKPEKPVYHSL